MVTMQVLLLVFLVIANICLNSLYGYSLSSSVNIFKTKRTSTSILHSNDISSTNKIESCGSCVNAPKCSGEYLSKGCDGTGKIQGGIATVSLFSWWPIKVFRPCPSYLQAGYVYRREGQTMDQVLFSEPSTKMRERMEALRATASEETKKQAEAQTQPSKLDANIDEAALRLLNERFGKKESE